MGFIVAMPPCGAAVTTQSVAVTGTSTAAASTFKAQTFVVRLASNQACEYSIGDGGQTASTATKYLPGLTIEYVKVRPGQSFAVIKVPNATGLDGATPADGVCWVTEYTA